MDFINKFKHGDDKEEEDKPTYADSSVQTGETQTLSHDPPKHDAEEPSRDFLGKLIGGSGHHHSHDHEGAGDADKKRHSFLERLGRKEDREKKQLELEKRELELKYELERVEKEKKDNEGFFDRLKDKFDGDIDKEKTQHEQKEDDKPSFFEKITGKEEREKKAAELDREEAEIRAEMAKIAQEKKENQDLLQRIKDHLDGDEEEEEKKKSKEDKPSFFDKIAGKAEEEERRRKEEENKNAFKKLTDRLNEGMGGGRKAEEQEDLLDKTIDAIQQYVLLEGPQQQESCLEQIKDKQIAQFIRNQLHLKQKKDDE
ncbi:hypothetical protein VP1G_10229 [Cytospora mali]|uniref:Uncharacterized protein n=1 Tax=Cytospora mali TaxID=578113 RepID=A0A194VGH0_CYTMA|nr:hypothetical protein VP1G_10229 [Valsa mali var. pyri (nom. inval.)]